MMKQWIALLTVLCMVLCLGGCATTEAPTAEEPAVGEETAQMQPSQPLTALTATVTVHNSEEINTFIDSVTRMQPVSYTNTRTVDGVETTYTLHYEGAQTAQARVVIQTPDATTEQTGSLFLMPYYGMFLDATGQNIDAQAYVAALDELGLTPVLQQKQLQTMYGVYVLGYIDVIGQPHVVDFWLNEQEVMQIEFMMMLQGGGMMLQ